MRALTGEAERARILAEVDTVRTALLAAVGHDLRTPLAGIKAAVTTLRQPDVDLAASDRDELLAAIEHSTDRLTDLIANLLDLSRLEAGALSINVEAVSLDEVISRVLIDRRLHTVVNRVADNLPLVAADAGLLERIVANLVDNAHRHAPPGSPVDHRGRNGRRRGPARRRRPRTRRCRNRMGAHVRAVPATATIAAPTPESASGWPSPAASPTRWAAPSNPVTPPAVA